MNFPVYGVGLHSYVNKRQQFVSIWHIFNKAPTVVRKKLHAGDTLKMVNGVKVFSVADVYRAIHNVPEQEEYSVFLFRPKRQSVIYKNNLLIPNGTPVQKNLNGKFYDGWVEQMHTGPTKISNAHYLLKFTDGNEERMDRAKVLELLIPPPLPPKLPSKKRQKISKQLVQTSGRLKPGMAQAYSEGQKQLLSIHDFNHQLSGPSFSSKTGGSFQKKVLGILRNVLQTYRIANPSFEDIYLGHTMIEKKFEGYGTFRGVVESLQVPYYTIRYEDGDDEEMDEDDIRSHLKPSNFSTEDIRHKEPAFNMNSLALLSKCDRQLFIDYIAIKANLSKNQISPNLNIFLKQGPARAVFSELLDMLPKSKKSSQSANNYNKPQLSVYQAQKEFATEPFRVTVKLVKQKSMGLHLVADNGINRVFVAGISSSAPATVKHLLCEGDQIVQLDNISLNLLENVDVIVDAITVGIPEGQVMHLTVLREPQASGTFPSPFGSYHSVQLVKVEKLGIGLGGTDWTDPEDGQVAYVVITHFTSQAQQHISSQLKVHDIILRINRTRVRSLRHSLDILSVIPLNNPFVIDVFRPSVLAENVQEVEVRRSALLPVASIPHSSSKCEQYGVVDLQFNGSLGLVVEEDSFNKTNVVVNILDSAPETIKCLIRCGDCISGLVCDKVITTPAHGYTALCRRLKEVNSCIRNDFEQGIVSFIPTGEMSPLVPQKRVKELLDVYIQQELEEFMDQLICDIIVLVLDVPKLDYSGGCGDNFNSATLQVIMNEMVHKVGQVCEKEDTMVFEEAVEMAGKIIESKKAIVSSNDNQEGWVHQDHESRPCIVDLRKISRFQENGDNILNGTFWLL